MPGPSLSFLVVISQERPEVEPAGVLGSPPADQHQLERPGQDFWLITRELKQAPCPNSAIHLKLIITLRTLFKSGI